MAGQPEPLVRTSALRGIAWMVLSTLFFACMHGAVRHVSAAVHPFEIAFFRNLFGLLVIAPWLMRLGLAPLRTTRIATHGVRAALNVMAMLMFFMALSLAPLTDVTALAFTAPIFASLLAMVLMGELVGWRRWSAIGFGFAGVLVVLRPGLGEIGGGEVLALVAAAVWGGVLVIIKDLGRTDTSVTITAYMSLLMTPLALVPALFVWQWPDWQSLAWLVAIGILGNLGQLTTAQALREGDTSVVMPFDFGKLVWITVIAYLAFAEVPSPFAWLGGGMILASAVYIAVRERRVERRRSRDAAAAKPPCRPGPAR
jgi:drug/metabolite transporter (DMT)-like permease